MCATTNTLAVIRYLHGQDNFSDIYHVDYNGGKLVHHLCKNAINIDIFHYLIQAGIEVVEFDNRNRSPLFSSCLNRNLPCALAMLDNLILAYGLSATNLNHDNEDCLLFTIKYASHRSAILKHLFQHLGYKVPSNTYTNNELDNITGS